MTSSPLDPDPFAYYTSDGVVPIRSMTTIVWCAGKDDIHRMVTDAVDFEALLAELDTLDCGPHAIEALFYPFIGSGVAAETKDGLYAIGTLCETQTDFNAYLAAGTPIPWMLILPDKTAVKFSIDPHIIQALFVAFTGTKTFGDMHTDVDAAMKQLAEWRRQDTQE